MEVQTVTTKSIKLSPGQISKIILSVFPPNSKILIDGNEATVTIQEDVGNMKLETVKA